MALERLAKCGMKAVIELDVPEWQIGQDVSVYFPDTMLKHGKCELLKEQSTKCWHKMNWEDTSELKDHYYYLVTHKGFGTPMKAKWHDEMGGCFEVLGVTYGFDIGREYWYSWELDNPIIAWMEMPDIYKGG